ncbi:MAG TPA: hypothetical protein VEV84_16345 [Pyrinomonadaceae bacterium]|nr:hypothetical protein [Pyrinomonadaceae bacterium]
MRKLALSVIIAAFFALSVAAQDDQIQKAPLSQPEIDKILKKVSENEGMFRQALGQYNFDRSATIQTVGLGGNITGTYRRDSELIIQPDGPRMEKIIFAPTPTLTEISVTAEDLEDLGGVNPFALDPANVSQYNFNYVGKQHIDELDLYVFDVTPKVIPDPKKSKLRLFTGRIWVDDHDLMIVKSRGKAVPETKDNKFPVVETWRENIDGKYWFPTYVSADDQLVFGNGDVHHIRMKVKYNNYKLAHTDVRIIAEEDEKPSANPTPSPTPKKPE